MPRKLTALVIGNAAYPDAAKLRNPVHDAQDVSAAMAACNFSVATIVDSGLKGMERVLRAFKSDLKGSEVGLFFFAGHGMQIEGENYLNAIDTDFEDEMEAKHSSLALNKVIDLMERSGTATNIIVLDACRNNPYERAWRRSAAVRGARPCPGLCAKGHVDRLCDFPWTVCVGWQRPQWCLHAGAVAAPTRAGLLD
jgi:uncharacterized caspase-like protein